MLYCKRQMRNTIYRKVHFMKHGMLTTKKKRKKRVREKFHSGILLKKGILTKLNSEKQIYITGTFS